MQSSDQVPIQQWTGMNSAFRARLHPPAMFAVPAMAPFHVVDHATTRIGKNLEGFA